MEIGAKQYDKEGARFGPQNVRKSRRAKMGLPSAPFRSNAKIESFHAMLEASLISAQLTDLRNTESVCI